MNEEYFLELIGKKLSGSLSMEEEGEFQNEIQNSSQRLDLYQKYKKIWIDGKQEIIGKDSDEVFRSVKTQMTNPSIHENQINISHYPHFSWALFLKIAATVLIIVSATFGFFHVYQKIGVNADNSNNDFISKSNPRGQKSLIILPDGSRVKLNAESYLEYPQKFETEYREVKLVGEAFFEVQKNPLKPFIVRSGSISVKVLGTSFNIKAHPYENSYSVAVATGKVAVSKGIESGKDTLIATLLPDEMVRIDHDKNTYEIKKFNRDKELGWKDGILVFDNDKAQNIIQTLEQWYGVDFIYNKNNLPKGGYTGRYQNASLEMVMDGWSYTSDFKYRMVGKKVYINN